eukprot:7975542-Alexandrium_andersonii.AAC.1
MLISAAILVNPQSALRKTHKCLRRSELELRGPTHGHEIGPRRSRTGRSAPFLALSPNLPTKTRIER